MKAILNVERIPFLNVNLVYQSNMNKLCIKFEFNVKIVQNKKSVI